MSLKGAKSPTRGRKLRSTGTKARAHVGDEPTLELKEQLEARTRELAEARRQLSEALEQQTATSEVLHVISSSPGELEPVFNAMLENATRICEADLGTMALYENGAFRHVALHGAPPAYAELRQREPVIRPHPDAPLGRLARTKDVVHVDDMLAQPDHAQGGLAKSAGARTVLGVPLLKEQELIGTIFIYRQEVRPFSDKQIDLVRNFAAQAVIAIENTRLLKELRQRTDDLSEALEQQTATSEVLGVISSSPGELDPVFQAMLENATRICGAKFGVLYLCEGETFRPIATSGMPPALAEDLRRIGLRRPGPNSALGRLARTKQTAHIADVLTEKGFFDPPPGFTAPLLTQLAGARTLVAVPMLKENELVGAIVIYRQEPRPFSDKQIELVTNFARQAVIAIENTRLLNELRQRTDDLSEALEQQTATSEVLQVISSSSGELEPVFNAMLENATRICEAKFGTLYLCEGDAFRLAAMHNPPPAFAEERRREPVFRISPATALARAAKTRQPVQIADVQAESAYHTDPRAAALVRLAGYRTILCVPVLKEDELIGVISIYRQEVRPFTDKQIELVKNFAKQAVIAIENARLLNELRESLQQQTATADVLKVISRSTFDLQVVLDTLVRSAARVCQADSAFIWKLENHGFQLAAMSEVDTDFAKFAREHSPPTRSAHCSRAGRVGNAYRPHSRHPPRF